MLNGLQLIIQRALLDDCLTNNYSDSAIDHFFYVMPEVSVGVIKQDSLEGHMTPETQQFPEVEMVHSTSACAIIPKMNIYFSTHGLPLIIKSDNGPPFNDEDIRKYMAENGINYSK